jgi:hypothetical protein
MDELIHIALRGHKLPVNRVEDIVGRAEWLETVAEAVNEEIIDYNARWFWEEEEKWEGN